jgi:hypothetical protein
LESVNALRIIQVLTAQFADRGGTENHAGSKQPGQNPGTDLFKAQHKLGGNVSFNLRRRRPIDEFGTCKNCHFICL